MRQMPTVMLVHGLGRRQSSLKTMARSLRHVGYPVVNWAYRSTRQTLTDAARQLHHAYSIVAQHADCIHFVTHSMGGMVLRRLLALEALPQLGKIAMIAPPNNGSIVAQRLLGNPLLSAVLGPAAQELRDPAYLQATCALPVVPTLVIAGTKALDVRNPTSLLSATFLHEPSDGTVAVRETRLPHMARFVEVPDCHTWMMNHPRTVREIVTFFGT
jgi:pimeloyl-ACP methyl ester carboxylesterase